MRKLLLLAFFFISVSTIKSQEIIYSHDAGFYKQPFTLTLQTAVALQDIVYTLDGSNPRFSKNSFTAKSPVNISINPDNTDGRASTPCFIVRASLKNGDSIYFPLCKTYIFIDNVKKQTSPGGNWPAEAYFSVNGHNLDYSMDTKVVNSAEYSVLIDTALKSIPSISVAVDANDLFDSKTGIYVNAASTGEEWERDCSFEIIDPVSNSQKTQINGGLRIKGGWSKQQNYNPKYSLRVLFKEKYGKKELKFPLFGSEGASSFSSIDLRTEQNCNWTLDGNTIKHNTFLRDIFARDCQRDMNCPYIRSQYYHLYLNGMYWGLYMTHERVDKDYAKNYFDGTKDEYDVIKDADVIDGTGESWKALWTMADGGFLTNERYFFLEGKNKDGIPTKGGRVLCDIDNLIDYMLIVFYTGNFDGPVSKWSGNASASNFGAVKEKSDHSFGYKFFASDFEYSMFTEPVYIGVGLNENRVNIGTTDDGRRMTTSDYPNFNPQWLHFKLSDNAEYRMRFIDRAYKYFKGDGALTPSKNEARLATRKAQINMAIIGESARWGDAQVDSGEMAMTKKDWLTEVSTLEDVFFPQRTDIVIQQLKDVGLFSNLDAPEIFISGKKINETYRITGTEILKITNLSGNGSIYYTDNDLDPRSIGGSVASYAKKVDIFSINISISNSMVIKARIKNGDDWGPIASVKVLADISAEDYSKLKVTELNYHPNNEYVDTGTISGDDFEFIEFKNTGTVALNISGLRIDSAVHYQAPANTVIAPLEYFVVASKPNKFFYRYSLNASGNFTGGFSNSGELVMVEDSLQRKILSFTYSDKYPWPKIADGGGYTLVSVEKDPTGDPNNFRYWTSSDSITGNPFSDVPIAVDKEFTSIYHEFAAKFTIYPNPVTDFLYIESGIENIQSSLVICDMFGREITKIQFRSQTSVDFRSLNIIKGLYIVSVTNAKGTRTEKIIYK